MTTICNLFELLKRFYRPSPSPWTICVADKSAKVQRKSTTGVQPELLANQDALFLLLLPSTLVIRDDNEVVHLVHAQHPLTMQPAITVNLYHREYYVIGKSMHLRGS